METMIRPIARMRSDFPSKFGIPRQSGLVEELRSTIVFEPEFRNPDTLRGIEGFSHLWLIWQFSEAVRDDWSPTVRPPRLGGNKRMGVFATRSPYRPNPIGLSSVKLISIVDGDDGVELIVEGADMLDGTPIYDIKPYLSYTDSHPDAICGFADMVKDYKLNVIIDDEILYKIDKKYHEEIFSILEGDPRPQYQDDPEREYGFLFSDYEIFFKVDNDTLIVTNIIKKD